MCDLGSILESFGVFFWCCLRLTRSRGAKRATSKKHCKTQCLLHDFGEPARCKFQRKFVESVKKLIRTQEVVRRPFLTRLRGLLGTPFGTHLGSLFRPFEKRRATKQERKKNTQKKSAAAVRRGGADRLPPPDPPPVAYALPQDGTSSAWKRFPSSADPFEVTGVLEKNKAINLSIFPKQL